MLKRLLSFGTPFSLITTLFIPFRHGKNEQPSVGIIDAQSNKSTLVSSESKGFDAGKRIKGIKRHIIVDTLGMVLAVVIQEASVQDRDGAIEVISKLFGTWMIAFISAGTLVQGRYYRITDFQTVHYIPLTNPPVVNTGPVEPLIVHALANNSISETAQSELYPQDLIYYTTSNARMPGSAKGCILRRIDTEYRNDVCNDFRHIKYRRWKFAPPAFDPAAAYAQYAPVVHTDGAAYAVLKQGGFPAGSATAPAPNNDDWVQVYPDNTHYTSHLSTATGALFYTSNNGSQNPRNPPCPINASDFIDSVMFLNYGPIFTNNTVEQVPGSFYDLTCSLTIL